MSTMTEAQLLAEVTARCDQHGISWVHIDTPRYNRVKQNLTGFPDLFLCGSARIAFRELKAYTSMSSEQITWKYQLQAAGQDWGLWRPGDLESGRIDRELEGLNGPIDLDDTDRAFAAAMAANPPARRRRRKRQ